MNIDRHFLEFLVAGFFAGFVAMTILFIGFTWYVARNTRCSVCWRAWGVFADDRCRRHRIMRGDAR